MRWIRGRFDLLLAEHARRLEQLRAPGSLLAVVIEDSTRSPRPVRARAELVAALAAVDFVVLDARDIAADDLDDSRILDEFSLHVQQRHGGGAG